MAHGSVLKLSPRALLAGFGAVFASLTLQYCFSSDLFLWSNATRPGPEESLQCDNGNDPSATHLAAGKLTAQNQGCDGSRRQAQPPGGFSQPHCQHSFISVHVGASYYLPLQQLTCKEHTVTVFTA